MNIRRHQREWNDLGEMDPLWAILTKPGARFGKWDRDEFFATGAAAIGAFMEKAKALGHPESFETALDFGCGVGRLTRALSSYCKKCTGVDVSEVMVKRARELNAAFPACKFMVNAAADLSMFPDSSIDLIYTQYVLQHVPDRGTIAAYLAEFMRILRPEGLAFFQLPHSVPFINRLRPKRRIYGVLRSLGVSREFLYGTLNLYPIVMNYIAEETVKGIIAGLRGVLLKVEQDADLGRGYQNRTYYVTKRPC